MSRYLDPRVDVVFKKIFGDHPELLKSFLNSVLPLPEGHKIISLEYLPSEQVPRIPIFKSTVADVRCKDETGRIFIVEMQIQWTTWFMQRMLFSTSTAYVKQLEKGEDYSLLRPVYGLALLGDVFDRESLAWYHHYKLVNVETTQKEIKDLQLIFIELPKFMASNLREKKLQVLWLRFMVELNHNTKEISEALLEVPEIKKAIDLSEEAAYTKGELDAYDRYWDAVSREKTLMSGSYAEGRLEGIEKGKIDIAKKLLLKGSSIEFIVDATGLEPLILQKLQQERQLVEV